MDLELLLITFDRAAALDRTLATLHASPLRDVPLTVVDNCSPDDTPAVCERWQARFPDMRTVRHARNVGLSANYLRAVELSRGRYTWVLGDDDELLLDGAGEVLEAARAGEVDLISTGGPGREGWPAGVRRLRGLLDAGHRVVFALTFLPALVFRTELFDSAAVAAGYRNAANFYPHVPFLGAQLERDATVLVTRADLVRRRDATTPGSHLFWFVGWVRSAGLLADPRAVRATVYASEPTRLRWYAILAAAVAYERLEFPERVRGEVAELAWRLRGAQRLAVLACAPLALLPRPLIAAARRLAGRRREADEGGLYAVESRL